MIEREAGAPFRVRIATPENPLGVRGGTLPDVELEVQSWGRPNAERSNAVLLCHSFSADAFAAGVDPGATSGNRPWRVGARGWWDDLLGPGKALDTDRFWIVCSAVLGGSGGSTGPNTAATEAPTAAAPASTITASAVSRSVARASAAAPAERTPSEPPPAPIVSATSPSVCVPARPPAVQDAGCPGSASRR
jgi:hypothetical protein